MGGFTESHRAHLAKLNEKNAQIREERMDKLTKFFANHEGGASVKEITIELGIPAPSVRSYLKEMVADGRVVVLGRDWRTVLYGWHKGEAVPVPQEKVEELIPVGFGGKEITEVKPIVHVNQGDLVWASSRSGDGAFFLYLVLTPWEKKATVIGTFPEGHPCLNLNDSRNVYLGKFDGKTWYANLDNVCSRAYAQFGESAGSVDDSAMNEIKERLRRYYRIPLTDNDTAISDAVLLAKRGVKQLKADNERLKSDNESLRQTAKNLSIECDEKKRAWDDMKKLADEALSTIDDLETKNKDLGIQLDQMGKDIVDLEAENDKLKKQIAEQEEAHAETDVTTFTNDVREHIDSLLYYIGRLEEKIEGKDALIAQQKETIEKYAYSLDQALVALGK